VGFVRGIMSRLFFGDEDGRMELDSSDIAGRQIL